MQRLFLAAVGCGTRTYRIYEYLCIYTYRNVAKTTNELEKTRVKSGKITENDKNNEKICKNQLTYMHGGCIVYTVNSS